MNNGTLPTMQLLAVSGPFHYWGPVVDGQYLREAPARALQRPPRTKVDLLIGSSQDDGVIYRAKAVKVGGARPLEDLVLQA
jgi:thyroglobulin